VLAPAAAPAQDQNPFFKIEHISCDKDGVQYSPIVTVANVGTDEGACEVRIWIYDDEGSTDALFNDDKTAEILAGDSARVIFIPFSDGLDYATLYYRIIVVTPGPPDDPNFYVYDSASGFWSF
jgi:hypothetical protein